jgi:hypothetical protein
MAQPGYIFGKGTPDTYESLQAKRRTAERFGLAAMRTPQNLGEGLSALGQAIAYRRLMNQADAGDAAGRAAYDEKRSSVLGALMGRSLGGTPGFNPGAPMPVTANPAGLDPSIIAAVDRVDPQGREAEIRAGLIERGMAPHIADGFLMNFKDESGLDPGINEAKPIVPGSRGGFGLAQWTGPRRVALEKFAAARGAAPSDAKVQMDFLMAELQGPESSAARNIFAAPDAGSAAAAIATDFLRPAPEHLSRRVAEYTGINPGASIPAIMEIMADPYAPEGDKMVLGALLEQQLAQMQPPDPMRALEMEYKQSQIDQMRNPQMADAPQVETFYDQTTGQQYKAQWNGQEWVPVGGVQAADGPLVEVNTGGGKFEEAFAKGDADTVATVYNSGLAATRNLGRIDQLEALLNASPTGAGAALAQIAGEWGINTEGLDQIQAAQAVINSLVPEQRQPGSGPMSDADLALFKQSLPRIINQPGGNQTIVNTMRGIAQYDAEGAAIVQRLRSGEIDRPTAFKLLQDRKNPLAGMKVPAAASVPAPGATLTYNPQTGEFE